MQIQAIHLTDEQKMNVIKAFVGNVPVSTSPMLHRNNLKLLERLQKMSADALLASLPPEALTQIDAVARGDQPFLCIENLPGLRQPRYEFLPPFTPDDVESVPESGQLGEYVLLGLSRLTGGPLKHKKDFWLDNVIKGWPHAKEEPWHTHGQLGVAGVYGYRGPEDAPVRVIAASDIYGFADDAVKKSLLTPFEFFKGEPPLAVMERDRHGHLVFNERFTRGENYDDLLERIAVEPLALFAHGEKDRMLAFVGECFTNPSRHYSFNVNPGTLFLTDQAQTLRCSDRYEDPSHELTKRWASSGGISCEAKLRHRDQLRNGTLPDDPPQEFSREDRMKLIDGTMRGYLRHMLALSKSGNAR